MGILDDAIREHLELKRQHGAPEEELKRQEDEALGPARREVAQQPEGADEAAGEPVADGEPPVADGEPRAPFEAQPPDLVEPQEDVPRYEPSGEEPEHAPAEEASELADHPPAEPPQDHGPDAVDQGPDSEDPFGGDEPFSGREADDEVLDDDDGEPDVLEDTPDFLQETPEHDRLWFEQKPPRDFDFE